MPALQAWPIIALGTSFWHYQAMLGRRHSGVHVFAAIFALTLAAVPALAKKKPPAHPVNINTANSADLQQVPGIGPATAQKILDTRKSYGTFKSVDDLLAIKGIGPKKLEKMRKYLTVGKPPKKKQSDAPQSAAVPNKPPPLKSPAKQAAAPTATEDEEP
ncbi:MAG TPA: helix-hairpin-helix domain-containing protein [Candidatus Acidoferrum sp.]|nr:helix-hairpin-helix domain-containing protein [Candidatus Acidoferrum sp.]